MAVNERVALDREGWAVEVSLSRDSERAAWGLEAITLRPTDPAATGREVRALPFGEMLAEARSIASGRHVGQPRAGGVLTQPSDVALPGFTVSGQRRTDRDYAELAMEYAFLVQAGERSASARLAEKFGGNARTWTLRVGEARKRGLLTYPAKRGEVGGVVTEKASALLGFDTDPVD